MYSLLRWIFPEHTCTKLAANYTWSVRDAYIHATSTIPNNSGFLLITGLTEARNDPRQLGLPSWVPPHGETAQQWPISFAGCRQEIDASRYRISRGNIYSPETDVSFSHSPATQRSKFLSKTRGKLSSGMTLSIRNPSPSTDDELSLTDELQPKTQMKIPTGQPTWHLPNRASTFATTLQIIGNGSRNFFSTDSGKKI